MTTTTASIPAVTALLECLTAEQLAHALACRRARDVITGPTWRDDVDRITAHADPDTMAAFAGSPRARAARTVGHLRGIGIDDDIIGCAIARGLDAAGMSADEAEAVACGLTGWAPRTDDDRWAAVATDMIADGWPRDVVAASIDHVVGR